MNVSIYEVFEQCYRDSFFFSEGKNPDLVIQLVNQRASEMLPLSIGLQSVKSKVMKYGTASILEQVTRHS